MHSGFYPSSCWWILWLPLASREPTCDRRRAPWLYAVYKYLTAFTPLFRIPLTQWTLHYSKATFDIFLLFLPRLPPMGNSIPFSVKVKATGKTKSSQQLRTVCPLQFSAGRLYGYVHAYMGQENAPLYGYVYVHIHVCSGSCVCEDLYTHVCTCMWVKARGQASVLLFICCLPFSSDRTSQVS